MSLLRFAPKAVVCWILALAAPVVVSAQTSFMPQAGEYPIAGLLPGDQVHPQAGLSSAGGYLVWEDNITDGYGLGISAMRLDSGFSAAFAPFRVNATGADEQENPVVTMLSNGGAAFAWQGGPRSSQHIYTRFLSPTNTWLNDADVMVNSATNRFQLNPVLSTLANGNVVITYASINQAAADSMQDVYAQIFSPAGQKVGPEIAVNQFKLYNQRTPTIAGLSDGRFVVAWVSEQQRADLAVDIYARVFSANGAPVGNEFLVDTTTNVCANPSVAPGMDGGFVLVWGQKDLAVRTNGWDIFTRSYSSAGVGAAVRQLNTFVFGDQIAPKVSAVPSGYITVWTSLSQDGSWEGVYGRFLDAGGSPWGDEFRVNTTVVGRQIHPTVASDGEGRFLALWCSFSDYTTGMDLYAQRYVDTAQPLPPMNAPYVFVPFIVSNAVYQPQIQVSWPLQVGLPVDHYEVYVDGSGTPAASVTNNVWRMTAANGLSANSSHTFQVCYVTTSNRRSPLSPAATAATWMGYSWYGTVPFEWMAGHYGYDTSKWPVPNATVSPDGPTVGQVFMTGANPLDSSTWLRTSLVQTPQGYFLTWNPQPGLIYQVQTSTNLTSWTDAGGPRFAAGTSDSLYVGGNNTAYYRIVKLQ